MQIKLLAVGNVLMEDDGIAIFLADLLENSLTGLGVEIIYGETDIGYSLSRIDDKDTVIILDAARLGKEAGEVTLLTLTDYENVTNSNNWHDIGVPNLIKLFYPNCCLYILAVEAYEIDFHYGPSTVLKEMLSVIVQRIMTRINTVLCDYQKSQVWESE